jgi:GNAT superfamily N-acetyltransferase
LQGALVTHAMGDHLFLETVAVAPGAQGRGYGALLLARADQDAYEADLDEIRLYTNVAMTENLSFYPQPGAVEYLTPRLARSGQIHEVRVSVGGVNPHRAQSRPQ